MLSLMLLLMPAMENEMWELGNKIVANSEMLSRQNKENVELKQKISQLKVKLNSKEAQLQKIIEEGNQHNFQLQEISKEIEIKQGNAVKIKTRLLDLEKEAQKLKQENICKLCCL